MPKLCLVYHSKEYGNANLSLKNEKWRMKRMKELKKIPGEGGKDYSLKI